MGLWRQYSYMHSRLQFEIVLDTYVAMFLFNAKKLGSLYTFIAMEIINIRTLTSRSAYVHQSFEVTLKTHVVAGI